MNSNNTYNSLFLRSKFSYAFKNMVLLSFLFLFSSFKLNDPVKEIKLDPIKSYDEVPVEFLVSGYLRFETDVIITDAKKVYIKLEDLFKNLGIACKPTDNGENLAGFIEKESRKYTVNLANHEIKIDNRSIQSKNGIIKELDAIYVESTVITDAFGLNIVFNYRSLSIKLDANFELPRVKQLRLEQMRENISKLQNNEIKADTILKRNYHLLNGSVADWSFASYQAENQKTINRFGLGIGTEFLYGQANVSVDYNDSYEFTNRQLYYNWRWVDDTKKYIKQAQVGKIFSNSISFLGSPLVGASINNSPNTVRKATGFHTIQEYTEPNWTVELYINDNLVDYTEADASGLYVFEVPIVYGYTTLTLKFYGPLGEERVEERTMNVPFTFMPAKVLEYNVSGGVLEDGENSKYGRGELNYGVNRFITVGAGVEYLSRIPDSPAIPFASLAIQPFSKMILNFEYAHDVRMKGLLNYNFGKSSFLEIDYANYVDGQLATRFNADEERKIRLSLPFKMKKISGYTKLNFNQFVYSAFNYNQFDAVFSGYYKNYNANLATLVNWIGEKEAYVTSNLSLSYRMRSGLLFRPLIEYNLSNNKLIRYRAEIEKRVSKMYFSAAFERNELSKTNNAFLSFRYDLPFARTGLSASYSNKRMQFSETAQGSLAFGGDNGFINTGNNSALSKGGILFYPFLDMNQNGKREKGEQLVLLSNVKVSGGKAKINKKDSIVRVSDLNAFINYNVTFSNDDLDNISWQLKHKTYQVLIDPNQYKKVEVPILVLGEVSGMIYLNETGNTKGQRRITVQIYDEKNNKVAETLSESDGYYNYLGLKPGGYTVKVDEKQLRKLGYYSTPQEHKSTMEVLVDGDIVDGLDFTLKPINETVANKTKGENKIVKTKLVEVNKIEKSTAKAAQLESNEELQNLEKPAKINSTFYVIELGVYKKLLTSKELANLTPIFYEVLVNGDFRYFFGKYSSLREATSAKNGLLLRGIKSATVISNQTIDESTLTMLVTTKNDANKTNGKVITSAISNTSFKKISEMEGSFYSVQIGVFKKQVTQKELLNLSSIFYEVLPDSTTRYIAGSYQLKKDAKTAKNDIVVKGIKDAYVVAYENGSKIAVNELDKIRESMKVTTGTISGIVHYKSVNKVINNSIVVELWNENGKKIATTTINNDGVYIFSIEKQGKYTVKLEIEKLKKIAYKSIPLKHEAEIKISKDGTIIKGLDFAITNNKD